MAPTPTAVGGLFRQVIHYHLDNGAYDNALFFAERYAAQDTRSSEAIYLFALCHYRLGDYRSAYDVSKTMGYRGINLGCSWVFAQACLQLDRHKDGITALEKAKSLWSQKNSMGKHSSTGRAPYPDAPTILCLLGKLYQGYEDKKKSISCFEESMKMNPFQWDAFKLLCDMGVKVRVPNIFRVNDPLIRSFNYETINSMNAEAKEAPVNAVPDLSTKRAGLRNIASDIDPFRVNQTPDVHMSEANGKNIDGDFASRMHGVQNTRSKHSNALLKSLEVEVMETPTAPSAVDNVESKPMTSQEPPQAPTRRSRNLQPIDATDAPPRMNYRLGTRRAWAARDKSQEQSGELLSNPEPSTANTGVPRTGAIPPAERKRTLAGHPARPAIAEEQATRRSARLIKPSTRANASVANVNAAAPRELKKARPPVSRIVRPGSSGSNVGRVVSGNRKPLEESNGDVESSEVSKPKEVPQQPPAPQIPKVIEPDNANIEEAMRWILELVKKLASGYYLMSQFQCSEALAALGSLPQAHQNSTWVLALSGRAHYEQTSYADAEKFYRKLRALAPSRMEDMEIYSTVLWHLKRETDLSFLAHELVDSSWHSPQAWCALGNAWSLAKDPEQALRCFKRATQLDPKFAYGFTLQGHEYVTNEEFDKALTAYRQALAADKRHYNAYYGIGRVQQRLGAYDKALTHFQSAHSINPNNAVLVCCIGMALEKQKQIMPALRAYSKAVELAPRAPTTRYKKARALLAVGQIEEAQKELLVLKDIAPDEGTVHFLLATLYRSMNEKQLAVRHFTIALALDPKAGPQIKEAIESFEDDVPMDNSMIP